MSGNVEQFKNSKQVGLISDWFRVAVEGGTIDGRKIDRKWLEEMAASYDPEFYEANLFLNHWWDNGTYGQVTNVRLGEFQGRMSLENRIRPNGKLFQMNANGQAMYCSIEPKALEDGKAYHAGLGITNNPASIGTEKMKFSAHGSSHGFGSAPLAISEPILFSLQFSSMEQMPGAQAQGHNVPTPLAPLFPQTGGQQPNSEATNHSQPEPRKIFSLGSFFKPKKEDPVDPEIEKRFQGMEQNIQTMAAAMEQFATVIGGGAQPVATVPAATQFQQQPVVVQQPVFQQQPGGIAGTLANINQTMLTISQQFATQGQQIQVIAETPITTPAGEVKQFNASNGNQKKPIAW